MLLPRATWEVHSLAAYRRVLSQRELPRTAHVDGVNFDTLVALSLQAAQKHLRKTSWRHRAPAQLDAYARAYEEGRTILEVARSANASPYLLARSLVERLCAIPRASVSAYIHDPRLIADARLRREVAACAEADAHCSPFVDRVRAWVGAAHEWALQAGLRGGLQLPRAAWLSEGDLRDRSAARTPDVLLMRPIIVACPWGRCGGHAVCWLDSKALFGDPHVLAEAAPQLGAYSDLYGPGAVIFWQGFVEELDVCGGGGAPSGAASDAPRAKGGGGTASAPPTDAAAPSDAPLASWEPDVRVLLLSRLPRQWRPSTDAEAGECAAMIGAGSRQTLSVTAREPPAPTAACDWRVYAQATGLGERVLLPGAEAASAAAAARASLYAREDAAWREGHTQSR